MFDTLLIMVVGTVLFCIISVVFTGCYLAVKKDNNFRKK